jgi:hypothetical protein
MSHDPNAPKGSAPHSAVPLVEPDTDSNWDPASTIGYEAADPTLHAAFWNESLEATLSTRHLR